MRSNIPVQDQSPEVRWDGYSFIFEMNGFILEGTTPMQISLAIQGIFKNPSSLSMYQI